MTEHRALRYDLKFCRQLFGRADVRRFARHIRKTEHFDCFVSDPYQPHRIVRLKFDTIEQKQRMTAELEQAVAKWEQKIKAV